MYRKLIGKFYRSEVEGPSRKLLSRTATCNRFQVDRGAYSPDKAPERRNMKTTILMAGGLAMSLLSTGCLATHKYVAKTIAPVEQRVSGTEGKNSEQDTKITANATQIEAVDRDLS